ncbi:MAG TPA: monofunctional biosynthetic peptidoglycan transglycosylase [Gammaproteobacteria bacterium]|nr:monofunctional biosynthetic peptidoglycan transglycosylase [Gammaproteobacteria bacterium]
MSSSHKPAPHPAGRARRLGWRLLTIWWLSFLATFVGIGFRGVVNPSTTAFMQQRLLYLRAHGDAHARTDYQWVDYDAIAPSMRLAVVASEDQTFPYNDGFDWLAIEEALQHNRMSRYIRGASTITQQTAKNLYLWSGRSYFRKALEAYFTVLLDMEWPKQRILEMYLNTAQFDSNVFGVGAAARHLFNKSPAQLAPGEAALLAAALPAPDRSDVVDPSDYLLRRQSWILDQMQQLGSDYLTGIEADARR